MGKPIDFREAHDKRHGPAPEHVCRDAHGVKWFEFSAVFDDGAAQFTFNFWARDMADAERRLALVKENARCDGQVWGTVHL